MPNSLINLIDSEEILSPDKVLDAIKEIPYMKHQYRWSVETMRNLDEAGATKMLIGYSGVKKLSSRRLSRLGEACVLLKSIPQQQVDILPQKLEKKQQVLGATKTLPALRNQKTSRQSPSAADL
jgi:hypothetical protein